MDGTGRVSIRNRRFLKPITAYTSLPTRTFTPVQAPAVAPTQEGEEGENIGTDQDLPVNTQSHPGGVTQKGIDQPVPEPHDLPADDTPDQVTTARDDAQQALLNQGPILPMPRRTGRDRKQPRKLQDYHLGTLCYAGAVLQI